MPYKGTFSINARREKGRGLVYDVTVQDSDPASSAERYSNLTIKDLKKKARQFPGYRAHFTGVKSHATEADINSIL